MRTLILILIATPAVAGPIRPSDCDPGWVAICEPCGECERLHEGGDDDNSGVVTAVGDRFAGDVAVADVAGDKVTTGARSGALPAIPAWVGPMPRLPAPDDGYPRGGTEWQLPIPPPESESPVVSGAVPEPSAAWLVAACFLLGVRRWRRK
jgi:hypothetical protein